MKRVSWIPCVIYQYEKGGRFVLPYVEKNIESSRNTGAEHSYLFIRKDTENIKPDMFWVSCVISGLRTPTDSLFEFNNTASHR